MPTTTLEIQRLKKAEAYISECLAGFDTDTHEMRFQLLEAASSRIGGFDFCAFRTHWKIEDILPPEHLLDAAKTLVQLLDASGIHPALCLSALAREALDDASQRHSGAYHTDFRLALHLARSLEPHLCEGIKVIDPACGAGMLLTAVSIVACGPDRILSSEWLRHSVFAADLSPQALRGTRIALAALTDNLEAIIAMDAHWRVHDSLLAPDTRWQELSKDGFDVVVANPPWEKVKLTRHEYAKANGQARDYGTSYQLASLAGYEAAKNRRSALAESLVERYPLLAKGEPDLYVAFTELLYKITRPGGHGALLVPAGLIRSLSTEALRRALVGGTDELTFTVMENRARHFAIDTRFKFLHVNYTRKAEDSHSLRTIKIAHACADNAGVMVSDPVPLALKDLYRLRPDLTLPEVRSDKEWQLFKKMQAKGVAPDKDDSPWRAVFCREVDMTHGRRHFVKKAEEGCLPVIEGRMVQPHRLGCKAYVSGEGRSAQWRTLAPGLSRITPQFWLPTKAASSEARRRSGMVRAGFCDITGQTNERSMMATIVPSGVICGNKVPTITFPNDPSEDRLYLWLAIVNSLPFDWLMRRVVTTTVNYFVLLSLRLPDLDKDSLPGRRLIALARKLRDLDTAGNTGIDQAWRIASLRAEADFLVARAYGCSKDDVKLMLQDFPLLDRGQPALARDEASTITADLLLSMWARANDSDVSAFKRVEQARASGAVAYVSSEFSQCITTDRQEVRSEWK
ncbi:restriction endonuclease [Meridianimarinicoccus roseus]|uniref:site-specific DNA-methyltransferase (adenine-specific) n=1 Tax=Meridianimarinicoccus roseus TaxID=2072018 RepID=A0A2V2LJ30_9RHOB|nr:N-6 DNA methylase [Meridianimarinicoccus roseus]PWR02369.1 restriction endonuclease [Meridianimarinicoccus roseus]